WVLDIDGELASIAEFLTTDHFFREDEPAAWGNRSAAVGTPAGPQLVQIIRCNGMLLPLLVTKLIRKGVQRLDAKIRVVTEDQSEDQQVQECGEVTLTLALLEANQPRREKQGYSECGDEKKAHRELPLLKQWNPLPNRCACLMCQEQ